MTNFRTWKMLLQVVFQRGWVSMSTFLVGSGLSPYPLNALFIYYVMSSATVLAITVGRRIYLVPISAWPRLSPFTSSWPVSAHHLDPYLLVSVLSPISSILLSPGLSVASLYHVRLVSLSALRLLPFSLVTPSVGARIILPGLVKGMLASNRTSPRIPCPTFSEECGQPLGCRLCLSSHAPFCTEDQGSEVFVCLQACLEVLPFLNASPFLECLVG